MMGSSQVPQIDDINRGRLPPAAQGYNTTPLPPTVSTQNFNGGSLSRQVFPNGAWAPMGVPPVQPYSIQAPPPAVPTTRPSQPWFPYPSSNNPFAPFPALQQQNEGPGLGYMETTRVDRSAHLEPPPPQPPPITQVPGLHQSQASSESSVVQQARAVIADFESANDQVVNGEGFVGRVWGLFEDAKVEMIQYPTKDHNDLRHIFRELSNYMVDNLNIAMSLD
jgi:hypothetical protein